MTVALGQFMMFFALLLPAFRPSTGLRGSLIDLRDGKILAVALAATFILTIIAAVTARRWIAIIAGLSAISVVLLAVATQLILGHLSSSAGLFEAWGPGFWALGIGALLTAIVAFRLIAARRYV